MTTQDNMGGSPWRRGWRAVTTAFGVNLVVAGTTAYSFGLFVVPVAKEFTATRLQLGLAHTGSLVAVAVLAPFVGRLLDRVPVTRVLFAGALGLGAGLALLGAAPTLAVFILTYAVLIGAAEVLAGPLATSTLVGKRFEQGRTRALAIAALGASAGGVSIPLVASLFIENFSWRAAYAVLGAGAVVVMSLTIWLARGRPETVVAARSGQPQKTGPLYGVGAVLREPRFWLIACPVGLGYFAMQGGLVNLVPLAISRGISPLAAAGLVSVMTLGGLAGKLTTAALGDRLLPRMLIFFALSTLALGLAILLVAPDARTHIIGAALFGVGWGGLYPQLGGAIGYYFGRQRFGQTMGLVYPITSGFSMLAAPAWGAVYDRTGSYAPAVMAAIAATATGAVAVLWLGRQRLFVDEPTAGVA